MIARNLHRLKVEKGTLQTTSYAGLPLLTELAHNSGLVKTLDAIEGLRDRQGSFWTSDYVLGLALTVIAGGEGLDDTRMLRDDLGLKQLAFPSFPEANSFGRFLRRFRHRTLRRGPNSWKPASATSRCGERLSACHDQSPSPSWAQ